MRILVSHPLGRNPNSNPNPEYRSLCKSPDRKPNPNPNPTTEYRLLCESPPWIAIVDFVCFGENSVEDVV